MLTKYLFEFFCIPVLKDEVLEKQFFYKKELAKERVIDGRVFPLSLAPRGPYCAALPIIIY